LARANGCESFYETAKTRENQMSFITLDFESYYTKGLGFKTQTTEEYVKDRRFEVIGVGVKIDDQPSTWFSGTHAEIKEHLMKIDWDDAALLCHNTLFDGCILAWHFGINPAFMFDTLCMARAIHGVDAGGSLKALALRYGIGEKGDEVIHAEGKKRLDFSEEELHRYGEYCKNDVDLTLKLFKLLSSAFPENEIKLIDMTLRMFIQPAFLETKSFQSPDINRKAVDRVLTKALHLLNVLRNLFNDLGAVWVQRHCGFHSFLPLLGLLFNLVERFVFWV